MLPCWEYAQLHYYVMAQEGPGDRWVVRWYPPDGSIELLEEGVTHPPGGGFDPVVELNRRGRRGWEMIHMEVQAGPHPHENHSVVFARRWWFKRPLT